MSSDCSFSDSQTTRRRRAVPAAGARARPADTPRRARLRRRAGRARLTLPHAPAPRARRCAGERGQATIEVIGLLPLIVLLALVGFTVVASFTAHEQAGEAAGAGALALLQGGTDPRTAAREALPKSVRSRATITLSGRRIHVRVRPRTALPIPGLSARLAGTAHADAGPSTP